MKRVAFLKPFFSFNSDPAYEQDGLFEEKEIARKAWKTKKGYQLNEAKDFAEFFKYEKRDRKITSLLCTTLDLPGKATAILTAVLINSEKKFNEEDWQIFNLFANQVAIAAEIADLREEVRKAIDFRKEYEKHLDDILFQLQTLSLEEQRRIEEHIKSLIPAEQPNKITPFASAERVPISEELNGQLKEKVLGGGANAHLEVQGEDITVDEDLVSGGVFIRTPNPMDLGEQFPMKLFLSPSEDPIEVNCKVVWTNKYGYESKGLYRGMGVKFLDMQPEVQRKIAEYLQAQKLKWEGSSEAAKSN